MVYRRILPDFPSFRKPSPVKNRRSQNRIRAREETGLGLPSTAIQKAKRGTVDSKQRGIRQVTAVKEEAISAATTNIRNRMITRCDATELLKA